MPSWKKIIVEGSAPLVSSSLVVTGETLTDGYYTSITPSTQINDIIAEMNTALGRLVPSRPAGLTGRGLRVTNTTYQSGIAHSSDWAVSLRGNTPALQVLAGSTVNLTSSQASTAVAGATVQFSASTALGSDPTGQAIVSFTGTPPVGGTDGVLRVGNIADAYPSQPGFWYTFSASMVSVTAPRDAVTFSSASFTLRETGGTTVASQSIFTDSVATPVVTLTTNASAVAAPTTYISGIPTLVTGSTACNYTASIAGAVGKFYRTNILTVAETGVGGVFTSQTKTPPTIPASGSTVEIKDQLVVATGKFADPIDATAATITTTAVNIASTTGTGTTAFSDVYIDSVSVEGKRLYSSASTTFPDTNLNYLSNTFDSSIALTNSRNIYGSTIVEMQLRNGVYIKPAANYSGLYFPNIGSSYNYGTLNYNSGSFSQYYDITPGVGKQTLLMTINGTNLGTTDGTSKITTGISILVKFQYGASSYTAWGDANKANGSGGADGVGLMVADGDTRGTSTQLVKKLNLPSLNAGGFNASSATITRAYVRIINFQPTMATVNQVITFV